MEPPPPHPKLPHLLTNSPFMPKITITAEDDIYNIVARNLIYQIWTYYSNLSSRHTGFWRSETVMSIVGNCEKIGWKRMLTQPWIDMGDFVTRWCSNLFYPGATPHYPFPLNVSTPLCYDTLLHRTLNVHCGLNCCTAPQYGVQLTALHRRERTWVNGNPFTGSSQYFSPAEYFVNCHQKYFVKWSGTPRIVTTWATRRPSFVIIIATILITAILMDTRW